MNEYCLFVKQDNKRAAWKVIKGTPLTAFCLDHCHNPYTPYVILLKPIEFQESNTLYRTYAPLIHLPPPMEGACYWQESYIPFEGRRRMSGAVPHSPSSIISDVKG